MAAKSIKSLESRYTMIQFLIIIINPLVFVGYGMIIPNSTLLTFGWLSTCINPISNANPCSHGIIFNCPY